jgi:6-pyruvoyltetrahydropterin/6-carboxytetrahydropterin synthase
VNEVSLTRRVRFEAAHRLWSNQLDDAANERTYGKCAREGGHGHNYEVDVTVTGPVDRRSGLVMVRDELDAILDRHLVSRCDHRDLDRVIGPEWVSTGENLARLFFEWVEPRIPRPTRLARVRVWETPRNVFDAYPREGN